MSNYLHCRPVCAHLGRGFLWTTTVLQIKASTTCWHGRAVIWFSKGILLSGSIVVVPIACIEIAASLAFAGVGTAFNILLRSESLRNHSLKALAYSLHSLAIACAFPMVGLSTLYWRDPFLRSHIAIAIVDRILHLGVAVLIHQRTWDLCNNSAPGIINDLSKQIARDIKAMDLTQYNEEARAFIHAFNTEQLFRDPAYAQRAVYYLFCTKS